MDRELAIDAQGETALDDVRRVLDALDGGQPPTEVSLTITYAALQEGGDSSVAEASRAETGAVQSGTNEHLVLTMLAEFLDDTGAQRATRRELAEHFPDVSLGAEQIGSALSSLARRKQLLDREKTGAGPTEANTYALTSAGRAEHDRLGRHDELAPAVTE